MKFSLSKLVPIIAMSLSIHVHAVEQDITLIDPHPVVKISDFLSNMQKSGQLKSFIPLIQKNIETLVPDPNLQKKLTEALLKEIESGNFKFADHFPVLPLKQIGTLRSALGASGITKTKPAPEIPVLTGRLEDVLGACDSATPTPDPVIAQLPELSNGHFVNPTLTICEIDRSIKMAKILTSLSARNGSSITYNNKHITSASALISTLIETNHQVKMLDERVYANFLSYNWGQTEILWPAWLDTGVTLKSGAKLTVPMGHSQYTWQIQGPLVQANVRFFLGIAGTGFFPSIEMRPNWTGYKVVNEVSSENNRDLILKSLDAAALYLKHIVREIKTIVAQKKLPMQGYGYLGVCNDSIAVLESMTGLPTSLRPFPLLRAKALDASSERAPGLLSKSLLSLPKDGDDQPEKSDILKRTYGMMPYYDINQASLLGEDFLLLMKELEQEVKENSLK